MENPGEPKTGIEDDGPTLEEASRLSEQWLADVQGLPDFDETRDGPWLARILQNERGLHMLASQQLRRDRQLSAGGDSQDIIEHQLAVMRNVFGRSTRT